MCDDLPVELVVRELRLSTLEELKVPGVEDISRKLGARVETS